MSGGFIVSVAELPGGYSQGETLEELRTDIREAIELFLDDPGAPTPEEVPEFVGIERVDVSA